MSTITIQGTPVDFPDSGEDPNWAPAIIQFAQLVENALAAAIGPNDLAPQAFALDNSHLAATDVTITNFQFSSTDIRGAFCKYTVFRTRGATIMSQIGDMFIRFDGTAWVLDYTKQGDASITFSIDANGQVKFTTLSIGTAGIHTGYISFSAQTLPQS